MEVFINQIYTFSELFELCAYMRSQLGIIQTLQFLFLKEKCRFSFK